MHKFEPVKRLAERATGIGIPSRQEALSHVVRRKPLDIRFRDDGYVSNNPSLPLRIYRNAIRFSKGDPAALSRRFLKPMAGVSAGATACTNTSIIIRERMKCWAWPRAPLN
jgi:hypothetical protein